MLNIIHLAGFLLCLAPFKLAAQDQPLLLEEEHRYHFTMQGELSAPVEKEFLSALADLDPRMHVNTDPAAQEMKVLAYQPIDPAAVIAIAAQFGVTLIPRTVELISTREIEQL